MDDAPTCAANAPDQTTTMTLLAVLACSNVVLLFLVGLLMRRLERVHRKVSSLLKATYGAPPRSASKQYLGAAGASPPRPPSPVDPPGARAPPPLRPAPRAPSPARGELRPLERAIRRPAGYTTRRLLGDEGGVGYIGLLLRDFGVGTTNTTATMSAPPAAGGQGATTRARPDRRRADRAPAARRAPFRVNRRLDGHGRPL